MRSKIQISTTSSLKWKIINTFLNLRNFYTKYSSPYIYSKNHSYSLHSSHMTQHEVKAIIHKKNKNCPFPLCHLMGFFNCFTLCNYDNVESFIYSQALMMMSSRQGSVSVRNYSVPFEVGPMTIVKSVVRQSNIFSKADDAKSFSHNYSFST